MRGSNAIFSVWLINKIFGHSVTLQPAAGQELCSQCFRASVPTNRWWEQWNRATTLTCTTLKPSPYLMPKHPVEKVSRQYFFLAEFAFFLGKLWVKTGTTWRSQTLRVKCNFATHSLQCAFAGSGGDLSHAPGAGWTDGQSGSIGVRWSNMQSKSQKVSKMQTNAEHHICTQTLNGPTEQNLSILKISYYAKFILPIFPNKILCL